MTFVVLTCVGILFSALAAFGLLATSPGWFMFWFILIWLGLLPFLSSNFGEFAREVKVFPVIPITVPIKIPNGILISATGTGNINTGIDLGAEVNIIFTPTYAGAGRIRRHFWQLSLNRPESIGAEMAEMLKSSVKNLLTEIIVDNGWEWNRGNPNNHVLSNLRQIADELLDALRENDSPLVAAGILDEDNPSVSSVNANVTFTLSSVVADTDALSHMMVNLGPHGLRIAEALKRVKQL